MQPSRFPVREQATIAMTSRMPEAELPVYRTVPAAEPTTRRPTVSLVDDDPAFLILVRRLVESVGLRTALYTSAEAYLEACDPDQPGCLVTDLRMPGMSGLQLQSLLFRKVPGLPVILISGHADVTSAVQAMKLHAVDVVEKPFRNSELLERIQHAVRLDLARRSEQQAQSRITDQVRLLSERELEVMELVVAGRPNKQIAQQLDLSIKTVEYHRGRLMKKLDLDNVADLVRFARAAEGAKTVPQSAGGL